MNINKKYKLEELCSKDETRIPLQSVYVYQNGRTWAVVTEGKALAKVPVTIEEGELSRGNSIKASDFKFQRQNPALKKKDEMFCALEPIASPYPNFEQVFPQGEPVVSFGLDISLLVALGKALGSDKVKIEIIHQEKAFKVSPTDMYGNITDEAHGLIMPMKLKS